MLGRKKYGRIANKSQNAMRIVSAFLVLVMVIGLATALIPKQELLAADKNTNLEGFSAVMIADPHTSEDDHIFNGTPAEDGKIWTDKSVTTGAMYGVTAGEENFTVALSAIAQTYNTVTTEMTAEQKNVAYDVVFVLDFSGSMDYDIDDNTTRAEAMVDALNPSISALMENENSRIAVVGYSGSDVNDSRATTLLNLNHYSTTTTVTEDETEKEIYFEYVAGSRYSNAKIQTASGVSSKTSSNVSASKDITGGTPTQRGIYRALGILEANQKPADDIVRIPIVVLLTDGEAGSAQSDYKTLSTGTLYEGSANNESERYNDEVGAYTVLTANHVKSSIDKLYKERYDYSGILNESTESAAKFYTIGLDIEEHSWTHAMLNPSILTAEETKDKVDSAAVNMKSNLEKDATYGSSYAYSDSYHGGSMTAEQLATAFGDILESMQVKPRITSTVNDPVTTETTSVTGENVVFTDYLGYKMELKGDSQYLRYGGVNYRFDKGDNGNYVFSGYDQDDNAVTGPAVTKDERTYTLFDVTFNTVFDEEAEYNGQKGYWKITWSFPGALLPTYSRLTDYDNTDLDPIRMLYQVGLMNDVDLQEDSLKIDADGKLVTSAEQKVDKYVFHTNLYDYDAKDKDGDGICEPQAMTTSEYTPAKDNPYYYETGYVTNKLAAGYDNEEIATQYIRLDMNAVSTKLGEISGTADVALSNVSVSLGSYRSTATFNYGGKTYTVDLTGDRTDDAVWKGETSLPVTISLQDGNTTDVNVAVYVEAKYVDNTYWYDSLSISKVTIHGEVATLSGSTATLNDLTLTTYGDVLTETEEIVSVYMELKKDADGNFYVEDSEGNKIEVNEIDGDYSVKLGDKTYVSHIYYKYEEGQKSYVDKSLGKGAIAKSLVGQFKIKQPTTKEFAIDDKNFDEMFQYYPSNYDPAKNNVFSATRIVLKDGTQYGATGAPAQRVPGTINVCVDGILNGQTDINGQPMKVHFDFVIEEQTMATGIKKYILLDCNYYDEEQVYSVDVISSDTPDIATDAENNTYYSYDISYTIESTHPNATAEKGNITETDPHFFHSHLGDDGQMKARLGNNGRLSVNIADAYTKNVTVEKEWHDRLGNKLDGSLELLKEVSVTAGIYQEYSYVNDDGETQSQTGTNGLPFATAVLNYENGFTHTWFTPELPKYLVDEGGNYVLDGQNNKVEVTYVAGEVEGADGWALAEVVEAFTDAEDKFILENVPLAEFSPTVEKVWPNGIPEGYKVKIELWDNDGPVTTANKIDTEHVITAMLQQETGQSNGTLTVKFGDMELGSEPVNVADFGVENTVKLYEFVYAGEDGNGVGGAVGSGTHADKVTVTITVSNTSGEKLGISDASMTYHYTLDGEEKQATMETFRSQSIEDVETNTKTATFLMLYKTSVKAEVLLDGNVDEMETEAWYSALNKWNLPMLEKDSEDGTYKAITYSVKEYLYVPDVNGTEQLDDGTYSVYEQNEDGLIVIPKSDGSYQVFEVTTEHSTDYHFKITNKEAVTKISAEKKWIDNNNAYVTRPSKITFQLKADGTVKDSKEISLTQDAAGVATAEWSNLPVYKVTVDAEDKQILTKIVYSVDEAMGELPNSEHGYATTIEPYAQNPNHYIVTNRLSGDPVSIGVTKNWIDNNNAYGTRPVNLYMVLYRTFAESGAAEELVPGASIITLNKDNDWKDVTGWTGLPRYSDEGKEYVYLVKEFTSLTQRNVDGVTGYEVVEEASGLNNNDNYEITNKLADGSISKTVTKVWKDVALEAQRPASVTVKLTGTDGTTDTQVLTAPTWSYTWNNLKEYKDGVKIDYTISETKVGDVSVGDSASLVTVNGVSYEITVVDDGQSSEFVVTNTLVGTTSVSVEKKWENTPDGYAIPTVHFDIYNRFGGKQDESLTVSADKKTDSVEGLPKYNAQGAEIFYYLVERPVDPSSAPGIGKVYKVDSSIGNNEATNGTFKYTATNTYIPLLQEISGTKTWIGVTEERIPEEITIELYRRVGTGELELVTKDADANDLSPSWIKSADETVWTYTYRNLPIYEGNDTSKPYIYSVKETKIEEKNVADTDYTAVVNGLNITNTLGGTVGGAALDGTKEWSTVDAANIPDSIQIQLMRNVPNGSIEEAVDVNGKVVKINVAKPSGTDVTTWNFDFDGVTLPKYDADGKAYIYSVKELSVTAGSVTRQVAYSNATEGIVGDYTVTLNGMKITNARNKGTTIVFPIIKEWIIGASDELPGSITIKAVGSVGRYKHEVTKKLALTASEGIEVVTTVDNQWKYTFTGLPKYADDGISEYTYHVEETHVGETAVSNNAAGAWKVQTPDTDLIINSHSDISYSITVKKEWKNVAGNDIPDAIEVQLFQNGVAFGRTTTITPDNSGDWSYTYTGLPKSKDGTNDSASQYEYSVKEISVTADGVTRRVEESDGVRIVGDYKVTEPSPVKIDEANKTLTITNTRNVDDDKVKTTYAVTKKWVDADNHVPENITIQLMQGGMNIGEAYVWSGEATSAQWTYTFTGLDKYTANGITEHVYTAKETKIKDTAVTNNKAGDFFVTYEQQDKWGTVICNRLAQENVDKELRNYSVSKVWKNADDSVKTTNLPENISVQLKQGMNNYGDVYTFTSDDIANAWKHTFTNLRKYQDDGLTPYEYSVEEVKVAGVNVVNNQVGDYSVTHNSTSTETIITNKLLSSKMEIVVNKIWDGVTEENTPDSVVIQLHGGENIQNITLSSANEWKHTFTELPKYRADGITPYAYRVEEDSVTEGSTTRPVIYTSVTEGTVGDYTVGIAANADGTKVTITNTLKQGNKKDYSTSYTVTKKWNVPAGITLPTEITVELYANDVKVEDSAVVMTAANGWKHTFSNLRKYTDDGITEYVYSVKEIKIGNRDVVNNAAGAYTVNVIGNTITNTIAVAPTVDITITKNWEGVTGNNIPDNIRVALLRDGKVYKQIDLNKSEQVAGATTWTYTFIGLPKYSDGILEHQYTVQEVSVNGVKVENNKAGDYEVSVNGNTITNKLTGTIDSIQIEKIWKDEAKVGERPASIDVAVIRSIDGNNYESVEKHELTNASDWKLSLANRAYPKYDANGNLYTYKVVEVVEESGKEVWKRNNELVMYGNLQYKVNNSIASDGTFTITNTLFDEYDPDKDTGIKITKNWLDDNNKAGARPQEITVKLYQAGVQTALQEIKVTGESWTNTFAKVPMYDSNGKLIQYHVEEDSINNYTLKTLEGDAKDGFTLTNVYTPGDTSIMINKVWIDNSNELNLRPTDKLELHLYQNNVYYRPVILTSSVISTWTAIRNVPMVDANGVAYVYSIVEPQGAVNGEYGEPIYTTEGKNLTVTNKLVGTVSVVGVKEWTKIDEKYRPESVTVELWRRTNNSAEEQMKDGSGKALTIITNASNNWAYDFGTFDKYDENGALYTYVVKEVMVGDIPYAETDFVASKGTNEYDIANAIKESTTTEVVVSGIKTWIDNDNKYSMRPESITVSLLRDGVKIDSVEVKADEEGTWSYEFKDLPKYDMNNGKPYVYTIEEASVKDYLVTVNGHDLFNKLDESKIPTPVLQLEKTQALKGGEAISTVLKAKAEDIVTYTIKVSNNGITEATNISIFDKVPAGLELIKNSIKGGDKVSVTEDGVIEWTISEVLPGKSVTVSFDVKVPSVTKETSWVNVVSASFESIPGGPEGTSESNKVELISSVPEEASPNTSDINTAVTWTSLAFVSLMLSAILVIDKKRKNN